MNSKQLLMGIDIGTTNWKVVVFDTDGTCVFVDKVPTMTHYDEQGHSTYKPQEIWAAVSGMIRKAADRYGDDIKGISVTSMAEAVVPIGEDGEPCSDIITWFDNRSQKEAEYIVGTLGREKLYSITGLDPNPIFSIFKMMWIENNHPHIYEA